MSSTGERGKGQRQASDSDEAEQAGRPGSARRSESTRDDLELEEGPLMDDTYLRRSYSRVKSFGDFTIESMRSSSPVPLPQLLAICLTQLTQAMQITLPYTIGVFIVRDFGYSSEAEVSRKTGMLAANFCLAMFLTAYFWGRISDTYGRKGVVVLGNLFSAVSVVMFGLSGSYRMACAARFIGGFFNGIFGAVKTILGESCSAKDQGQALLFLSIAWGVGTILGPTIGGFLAQPCDKYHHIPLCEEGELFNARPYLLPCLLVGTASFGAFLSSCFLLTETLKGRAEQNGEQPLGGGEETPEPVGNSRRGAGIPYLSRMGSLRVLPSLKLRSSAGRGSGREGMKKEMAMVPPNRLSASAASSGTEEDIQGLLEGESEAHSADPEAGAARPARGRGANDLEDLAQEIQLLEGAEDGDEVAGLRNEAAGGCGTEDGSEEPWWKLRRIRLTLAGYGLVAFIYNLSDEVTPIYASTIPADGGLGFSTSQLGLPLAVSGVALLLYALGGYKRMQKHFGVQRLARVGLYLSVPVWLGVPAASLFLPSRHAAMAALCVTLAMKSVAGASTFTASMVMVNTSSPPSQLGQVNGMGQSVAAFVRGAGPAIGGLLWSCSIGTGLPYHQFLVFGLLSLMSIGTTLVYSPRFLEIPALE